MVEDRKASPGQPGTHTGLGIRFWVEAACGALTETGP